MMTATVTEMMTVVINPEREPWAGPTTGGMNTSRGAAATGLRFCRAYGPECREGAGENSSADRSEFDSLTARHDRKAHTPPSKRR